MHAEMLALWRTYPVESLSVAARYDGNRLTACRLAAASAGTQNAFDLVREAVGYSGVLGVLLTVHRAGRVTD